MVSRVEYKRSLKDTNPKKVYFFDLDDAKEHHPILKWSQEDAVLKALNKWGFVWHNW